MERTMLYILGLFVSVAVHSIVGLTLCACDTMECIDQRKTVCKAIHMCYVQYYSKDRPVTRGCIDTKSSILCENHRPKKIRGHWPVLHCCSTNLCNKDVLPTLPSWHHEVTHENDTQSPYEVVSADNIEPYSDGDPGTKRKTKGQLTNTVNPLHIALPVVACCILIALTICIVFVVRKRSYGKYQKTGVPPAKSQVSYRSDNRTPAAYTEESTDSRTCSLSAKQENSEGKLIV